jgi:hypothetical protein
MLHTETMTALLPRALNVLLGSAPQPIQVEREVPELSRMGWPPLFSFSPSATLVTRLRCEGYDHLRYFVALPSHRMPRWLLPVENASGMLGGTEIYLPHRWAPRTLKTMLVRIAELGCAGWLRSRILLASKGPLRLEALVEAVAGESHPRFSVSFGRQAAVRKLTVQVMRSPIDNANRGHRQKVDEIVGYIKLPLTDMACERVRHEAATLERLWNFLSLRKHIPRLLYAGNWNDTFVLFQSPLQGTTLECSPGRKAGKDSHSEGSRKLGEGSPAARRKMGQSGPGSSWTRHSAYRRQNAAFRRYAR